MRVVVIGGTRFIGAAVVGLLMDAGHEVTLFHRGRTEPGTPLPDVRHIHGDRAELGAFKSTFLQLRPELVIDLVLRSEAEARTTADTFAGITSKLVVISSIDVYRNFDRLRGVQVSPPDPEPLAEYAPLRQTPYPRRGDAAGPQDWRYHYDKIKVERVCQAIELPVTILRLPFVYGPGDYRRRLAPVLQLLHDETGPGGIEPSVAAFRCTRGYVQNVAAAIVMAALDPRANGQVYNVGEEIGFSEIEWIHEVARVGGGHRRITVEEGLPTAGDRADTLDWRPHLVVDTAAIRRDLGYRETVPFATGLKQTIAWERQN